MGDSVRETYEALRGFCWKCGATLNKDEDTLCKFVHRNPVPESTPKNTENQPEISREVLMANLCAARMALAYVRDKAESHTVTRSHLSNIAKNGILKSGGPITIGEVPGNTPLTEANLTDSGFPLQVDGRNFETPLDAAVWVLWLIQRFCHFIPESRIGEPCDGPRFREGIKEARALLTYLGYDIENGGKLKLDDQRRGG